MEAMEVTTDSGFWTESSSEADSLGSVPRIHVFSALDHTLFSGMLVISALIGIYFAFFAKQKQNTTSEYLMGGKNMGVAPVSMSLIASYISGIALLGYPAEIYVYGAQFSTMIIGILGATTGCGILFMPIFYELQLSTSYEYLDVRFDRKVRLLGSLLFIISCFLYIPIVIYMPALAFQQVTGINIHLITPMVSLVCIFYTSLGGLKAVVWTDAVQTVMMFLAMVVVVVMGTNAVGGLETVWQRNKDSDRLDFFNLDPDPTIRHTFWNTVFGAAFGWMTHMSVNQGMVQRFLAMPSLRKAQIMVAIFTFGIVLISALSCYSGFVIFATYYDCDRLSTKVVRAPDQLLPYYVMDVAGSLPGLPGLFMAGVFSAALSSMSTGLNSMAGVIYEDFIDPFVKVKVTEERISFYMKIICVVIGVLCVAMVFVVENLGAVIQVSGSLGGITSGPMLAIFALGMFFPWTNPTGAFTGGIVGLLVMGYISFGSQAAIATGQIKYATKPVTTEGCSFLPHDVSSAFGGEANVTSMIIDSIAVGTTAPMEEAWAIFRISYQLYTMVGLAVTIVVGLLMSFATGRTDPKTVHIDLLTPVIRPLFKDKCMTGDENAWWKRRNKDDDFKKDLAEAENFLMKESIVLVLNGETKALNNSH